MKMFELNENEYDDVDEKVRNALAFIKNNCQPFLKQNNTTKLLYRGMHRSTSEAYFLGKVRKNRSPVDMPKSIHDWLDNWFEVNFGFKARSNALFVTSNIEVAENYGNPFVIFPIGNFKYVWSPNVVDLYVRIYNDLKELMNKGKITWKMVVNDTIKEYPEVFDLVRKIVSGNYTNQDLTNAIGSKNEIMLHTDEYVAIPPDVWNTQTFDYRYEQLIKGTKR